MTWHNLVFCSEDIFGCFENWDQDIKIRIVALKDHNKLPSFYFPFFVFSIFR